MGPLTRYLCLGRAGGPPTGDRPAEAGGQGRARPRDQGQQQVIRGTGPGKGCQNAYTL